jgi:PHD/YefM family antitoxin component YafN of YafNO toxin-antitoxin module
MINQLPTIAPISDLRLRQAEIIEQAKEGPVILVERGSRPALIAISPEQWNLLAEQVEYLQDALAVYKKKWELATGQDELVELSPEEISEWLGDDLPA